MTGPIVTIIDIETAPLSAYCWGLWKQNIGLDMIQQEWSILSFAAKELGGSVVYWDNRAEPDPRVDYSLMLKLWEVLDSADIVVAQNGKKFDIRRINARFAMMGFAPPSPYRVIDTVLEARRKFGFTSNKLEWLSTHLTCAKKLKHKKFPGFELWKECLAGNQAAWNEMRKYNIADVVATEELYLKLRPWIDRHPNVAAYEESEDFACPKCGSRDIQFRGTAYTNLGSYKRVRCNGCYGWSRGRENLSKRKALLT